MISQTESHFPFGNEYLENNNSEHVIWWQKSSISCYPVICCGLKKKVGRWQRMGANSEPWFGKALSPTKLPRK